MSASPLAPGVTIADTYEIERQLGKGGMGEVWLAKHKRLAGKLVAIKVLHVDRELPTEALARFKREAEIAARLEHPNIVQVLDFNTLPTGQPYLVMEYLKGQSLAARAAGRPMAPELVMSVMSQVGAALQAAHKAGVVHRDLKPENIFLVPTALGDSVKVLDFGISKLSDSNTVKTTEAVLIGTPLYMSPEQALGHNSEVSAQSDLFSLGSITYELMCGKAPFAADSIAKVVFRIAYEKHAPLVSVDPNLPQAMVAAVEHALDKDRTRRTPSIEAFVLELTGKALADVSDESSGVFTPGMPVTSSMISGETRAPSSSPRLMATPAAPGTPAPSPRHPADAPTISGRRFVIITIVTVLVLAGVLTKVRMDNWAERAAYRAQMVDAGWTLTTDGNLVRDAGTEIVDAGAVAPVVAPVVVDAGAAEDAGVPELIDAGVKTTRVEAPLPPAEQEALNRVRAQMKSKQWEAIWDTRAALRIQFNSPAGKRQIIEVLLEVACARNDNEKVRQMLNEYRATPGANLRALRATCVKYYPSAADFDW
ncbi:MAG: serine/threonine-protein kinase [Archangium sp.]